MSELEKKYGDLEQEYVASRQSSKESISWYLKADVGKKQNELQKYLKKLKSNASNKHAVRKHYTKLKDYASCRDGWLGSKTMCIIVYYVNFYRNYFLPINYLACPDLKLYGYMCVVIVQIVKSIKIQFNGYICRRKKWRNF